MATVIFPAGSGQSPIDVVYMTAVEDRTRLLKTAVAGLVHNLRGPLTTIMGRAELISVRQPDLREPMHQLIGECERANAMMHTVVSTLVLEAEEGAHPVHVNDLVRREWEFLRLDRYFKHEVDVQMDLAETATTFEAVYGPLARAFIAVVQNAGIAMQGMERPSLTITTRSNEGVQEVCVHDSGSGIAPEHLPRVFEAGFTTCQDGRYGSEPVEGTGRGYGLTYAGWVIGQLGGTVEVTSNPGAGTRVTLKIPTE